MKKRKLALLAIVQATIAAVVVIFVAQSNSNSFSVEGTSDEYRMVLDSSNAPGDLDEGTYTRELTVEELIVKGDYSLTMKYRLAQLEKDRHVLLAPHGYMYNEIDNSDYENKITGLTYIIVNYDSTANMSISTSIRNDGKEFSKPVSVTNGVPVRFSHSPYYFILEAGDAVAHITSVVIGYSCAENTGYDLYSLSGTYSGLGTDGYRYLLELNNTGATFSSIDNPNPSLYNASVSLDGQKVTFSFNVSSQVGEFVTTASTDHRTLTFVEKTGICTMFPNVDFYKVYNVEDFEKYTSQGNGFGGSGRGADSLFDMSGLRAAYHSDFYSTSTSYAVSYLGDNGWRVMGSTDFLTYTSNKGYDGSKAAAFKGNSNGLRYIQFSGLQGIPHIIGKGSHLSFRAKAYSNSSLTTVKATESAIKVYGFYGQTITKQNLSSIRTSVDLTIPGGNDWTRYTIDLDSSKSYYSYGFYLSTSSTVYLVVDDVTIYTVDPYGPIAPTQVNVSPSSANLETGSSIQLSAQILPSDATNKEVTWSSDSPEIAQVSESGLVTAYSAGEATITATTVDGGITGTCNITVSGAYVAPYPSGSYKGKALAGSFGDFTVVLAFGNRDNGLISVKISNKDAVATGVTYDDATRQFTITTAGDYSGYSYGSITGTYDNVNDQLVNVGLSGQIGAVIQNNNEVVATKLDVWDCDGTTAQLQSLFKRRYNTGSWNVDNTNADRLTSNTTEFVSGTGSLKRRGYTGGAVALNFNADFSPAKNVQNIQFWVYNPSSSNITLRMWYYQATNFGNNGETGTVTALANQWTYVAMGFGENGKNRTIYNFQIADFNNTGVYLSFDNIALF